MALGGPAGKKAPAPAAAPPPAHLLFKVGGQGYLLTRQFTRPPWAKMIDTHAANSLPLLRWADREHRTFASALRSTFGHEIAPITQRDRRADVLRQVALLIERRRLYLFRLGEAPAPPPRRVSDLRMDEVRSPSPAVPRRPAVPQDGDPAPRDLTDRLLIVVEGMRDVPASELGRDAAELLATLATAGMALKIAAMLAAWIASHFTPVGWIIDVGMIGYGVWMVGVGFIDALKRLLEIAREIQKARTRGDLKRQSAPLAKLLIEAGLTAMLAFFLKGTSKGKKGSGGGGEHSAPTRQAASGRPAPVPGSSAAPPAPAGPGKAVQTYWPPNRGFAGTPVSEPLKQGALIDRYGYEGGTFLSPKGTPDWARSLAPGTTSKPYNIYEVVRPLDVQSGKAAPWFGQIGGGTQYELPMTVKDAVTKGYLKRVGP